MPRVILADNVSRREIRTGTEQVNRPLFYRCEILQRPVGQLPGQISAWGGAIAGRFSAKIASVIRLLIFLPAQSPRWSLLRELAHAMTSDVDGRSCGHRPIFMGLYFKLISCYFRLDPDLLS